MVVDRETVGWLLLELVTFYFVLLGLADTVGWL